MSQVHRKNVSKSTSDTKKEIACSLNSYFTPVFTEKEKDLKFRDQFSRTTKKELDSVRITAEMVIEKVRYV